MRIRLLTLLLLLTSKIFAQDSLTMDMLVPQAAVKFSPLHMINFYPTIEVSYEQKLARKLTTQLELGYVLNYNNDWRTDFQNKRGVKIKLEGRHYFAGVTRRHKLYYLAAEGYVNIINFDRSRTTRECYDLNCDHTFIRTGAYKMEYREQGGTFKVGMMRFYSKFFFDFSSGWTVRNINYRQPSGISSFQEDTVNFLDIPNENDRVTLSPYIGCRMGIRIR